MMEFYQKIKHNNRRHSLSFEKKIIRHKSIIIGIRDNVNLNKLSWKIQYTLRMRVI